MPCAVILTSLPDEYHAVCTHLIHLAEETHPQGTVYESGQFSANGKTWKVVVAQVNLENSDAAMETERAIAHWRPNVVLSVGVAAGLKDVTAADVVAAIKVYSYETGKVTASGFLPTPKLELASYVLEQRAKAEAKREDWLERIQREKPNWVPKVFVGAIAAGEKEITSNQSAVYQLLQANHGDALAVDVTGYGVLKAVHANADTNALIIRGITHVIGQDAATGPTTASIVAAQHASAFAFAILAKLEAGSLLSSSSAKYTKLKQNVADASKGLLSWQHTLSNKQQIKRSELDELLNRIKVEESSTTIVLGVPGSGKSALMATLGNELVIQGYSVLAIKADQLNGAINTIEDLQFDLHLELPPSDTVHAIASKEKIVVLIDQLDAVSELLDRKSQRLNLLLSLTQRLSGSKNVHIIATCREFEFRYGSQFARLAEIKQLFLSLPAWETISPILEAAGHQPASMGETLRELLQNPLHLNVFLDVAQLGDIFTSSQRLLDRLWEERVKKHPEAEKCVAFLERLADRMTKEEVLWVPNAIADASPEICRALEHAGLLMTNPENGNIGFRHQTYYDHTLARAFASGSQSLTDLVLERQDGLFIRPTLLRGLNYLRGTATQQYQKELTTLLQTSQQQIRHHIRSLLIEFVGAQSSPNLVEARLLIPLLNSEVEGIKVLDATTGSSGWFKRLRDRPEFTQWLEKPVEQAMYCSPFLAAAANSAPEDIWNLLEEYWLDDKTYDFLIIRVIWDIGQWTSERVRLIQQVVQRSNVDWHSVAAIAERIAEVLPNQAARVIRGHLDCLLTQATEASKMMPPVLPSDVDEVQRTVHAYRHAPLSPLKALLENESNFYEIEKIAEVHPQSFLELMWPWFTDLIQHILYDTNSDMLSYRWDQVGGFEFSRSKIIQSLLTAITKLAKQDKSTFLNFVEQNENSDLLIVHQLVACGLEVVASEEATRISNYLLADPRRFSLGSQMGSGRHRETEKLIAAIFPHLQPKDREQLEQTIQEFTYWQIQGDRDVDIRRRYRTYNREHRLSLLQAIPEEYLSPQARRLKEEEERALPWFNLNESSGITIAQNVGPRMTSNEMSHASDQHLLSLFNELSDETEWNHPQRQWFDDRSRAGGAIQQSREFGELVKNDPSRFIRILPQLEPQRHESYVGDALEDLAGTDFPAIDLIHIIEGLDQQGFVSENFRSEAAHALEKIAKRHQGLPQSSLSLLEGWLPNYSQPELDHYRSKEQQSSDLRSPILFGIRGSHILPGGRGNIVRAIAEGYLKQSPPNLEGWAKFIKSHIGVEPHPAVWCDILTRMPPLLNGNRTEATKLFNQVIQNCPEVLQYPWALYFISRTIGWFEPKEAAQGWLEILWSNNSNFSHQAYGELLLIHYLQYQDEWSIQRIHSHLAAQDNESVLCGLAHAASHLWSQRRCRAIAAKILYTLASSSATSVQYAVAKVFHCSRDHFELDSGMLKVLGAVCKNQSVLLESARDLTEILEAEELIDNYPEVVAEVCKSLIDLGAELKNPSRSTAFIAESLTTIAIKLHRQPVCRELGLQMFEQLLALNLRETRSALEMLDRTPTRLGCYVAPRRLRRQAII
ncbi:AAA family ATPase [Leptolyngbya sp. FACHB-261]|uniref:phosphorylase family protein n=1 Tax=Leptolyngbya sp. FACHB-261 TaxID=2692806 RepID=UPI0016845471|nr:AAA family ATPase [Leptolyngbya sp. FACHB-261]MBD2100975.1 AAA family ATPase [Leptolyngbya sp. FACHB-261]